MAQLNYKHITLTMITNIIALLSISDFYGESELIDIAKGKYQIPTNWIKAYKRKVRELIYKKKFNGN